MKRKSAFVMAVIFISLLIPNFKCSAADNSYWTDDGIRATSFSNTSGTTITIMNAAELSLLAYNVNNSVSTYNGYTIELSCDIDISAHKWKAIGSSATVCFSGVFDGKSYAIEGLYINESSNYQGLFGIAGASATIKNLCVKGNVTNTGIYTGGIAGTIQTGANIYNCVSYVEVNGDGSVGGIAGQLLGGAYNCISYGQVSGSSGVGAIIGTSNNVRTSSIIENCYWLQRTAINAYGSSPKTITNCYYFTMNGFQTSNINNTSSFTIGTFTISENSDLVFALNAWVNLNGSSYIPWFYDNGYAIFGELINVAINWGDIKGTYIQTYHPETRSNTYEWQSVTNTTTIMNASNVVLEANIKYIPNENGIGTDILFSDPAISAQAYNEYSFNMSFGIGAIPRDIIMKLSGTPTNYTSWNDTEIGTITITISKVR